MGFGSGQLESCVAGLHLHRVAEKPRAYHLWQEFVGDAMNIYEEKSWKRLVATVNAVVSYTAHSTYADNLATDSTAALPALASTGGSKFIFWAYDPVKRRKYVLRAMAS
jgi:hypothetical protein